MRVSYVLAAAAAVVLYPAVAGAQAGASGASQAAPAAQTPQSSQAPAAPASPVTAGWQDGFFIQSANGDFRLQVGLLVHADGRFTSGDDDRLINDTFLIRRLRPSLRGRFSRRFEFYLNPDFANGVLAVQDAYVDTIFSPAFRLRAGKAKTPFGMERLHSASNILFFERGLPTALAPNRDIGVQVLGDVGGGVVSYLAGLLNGVADGGSSDLDLADGKDVSARFVVRPFATNATSPLRGLGVAASGSVGKQNGTGAVPTLRSQSLQQQYFAYSGVSIEGTRTRYSPQLFYFNRRFGGWYERVHTESPIRKGAISEDVSKDAWQIVGSYMLTGEAATDASAGVRPRSNFDFGNGHWGAFQLAARYHTLKIDDVAFTRDLAAPGSSRKIEAWTLGLNWYLTPNLRYVFNYERAEFDDNAASARKPENGFLFRTQVNF